MSLTLDIGLINNMPDTALESTERQFRTLLDSAAPGITVRLWLYALPQIPRTELGRYHIDSCYTPIDDLWDRRLDGLIVTGAEPRATSLMDEPYWPNLTRIVEWVKRNTYTSIWSCLAAHAAVLHLDGIARRRLGEKRFGLFDYERIVEHPLTAGIPERFSMPHSRWNDLPEDELTASGYHILTRSPRAGADLFAKQSTSLFLFFQGHPEYQPNTLLREYIRDVGRYLSRQCHTYPALPRGYFDRHTADALTVLRVRAMAHRSPDLLSEFPSALSTFRPSNPWHPSAARIYRNWLDYLCARKQQGLHGLPVTDTAEIAITARFFA